MAPDAFARLVRAMSLAFVNGSAMRGGSFSFDSQEKRNDTLSILGYVDRRSCYSECTDGGCAVACNCTYGRRHEGLRVVS